MPTTVHALRPSIARTSLALPAIAPAGKRADGQCAGLAFAEADDG